MTTAYARGNAWRLAGLVGGIAAAYTLFTSPQSWLGLGQALAAPAFALCLLAGVIAGEVRPRPTEALRVAGLEVRRVGHYLPRALTAGVATLALTLAALLAVTTAVGSADDQGRAGRAYAVMCGPDRSNSGGPWPGSYYSVPILAAVGLGLIAAALTARIVARRRGPAADGPGGDELARRRSMRIIVAAAGVLTAAPLAGCAFMAAQVLGNVDCGGWPPLAWVSLGVAGAATVSAAGCVATVLGAQGRVPAQPPAHKPTRTSA